MKWTYIIRQKTKTATALAVVFGLMMITSLMDRNYFSELQRSVTSVYEDRLLAESYIYRLSGLLHEKKRLMNELVNVDEARAMQKSLDDSIRTLVVRYGKTYLTETESSLFGDLQQRLTHLSVLETRFGTGDSSEHQRVVALQHQKLSDNLNCLSELQLAETKNIVADTDRIIASSEATSRVEISILVVVGLMVQALILAARSEIPRFPQNSSLN